MIDFKGQWSYATTHAFPEGTPPEQPHARGASRLGVRLYPADAIVDAETGCLVPGLHGWAGQGQLAFLLACLF